VFDAARDGATKNRFSERQASGTPVYLGDADTHLGSEHADELRYRTDRQLGFSDEHDERYWNVTGNGWAFPIVRARATVLLPDAIPADRLRVSGYAGVSGSTAAGASRPSCSTRAKA
jgi:hypothetical protein